MIRSSTPRAAAAFAFAFALSIAAGSACKKTGTDAAPATDAVPATDALPPGTDAAFNLTDSGTTATVLAHVTEVQNNPAGPVAGVTVEYFARADVAETAPIASGTTDAAGDALLMIDVSTGPLDEFVKLSEGSGTFVDTYHYRSYATGMSKVRTLPITSTSTWNLFVGLAGGFPTGYDPATQAIAAFSVEDCTGAGAEGATVTATSGTIRYMMGGFPVGQTSTDASGEVVVFGVDAGAPATFTATLASAPAGCSGALTAMMDVDMRPDRPHLGVLRVP